MTFRVLCRINWRFISSYFKADCIFMTVHFPLLPSTALYSTTLRKWIVCQHAKNLLVQVNTSTSINFNCGMQDDICGLEWGVNNQMPFEHRTWSPWPEHVDSTQDSDISNASFQFWFVKEQVCHDTSWNATSNIVECKLLIWISYLCSQVRQAIHKYELSVTKRHLGLATCTH